MFDRKVLPGKTGFELGVHELSGSVPSAGEVPPAWPSGKNHLLLDDSVTPARTGADETCKSA